MENLEMWFKFRNLVYIRKVAKWGFVSYQKWFWKWFYYKNPNISSKWFSWFKRVY